MREIKFRAWHKATQSWLKITGFETDISNDDKTASINTGLGGMFHDGDYIGCFEDKGAKGENGAILVQYTGLKDKNGREVYEGDILKMVCELYTNFGKTPTGKYNTSFHEVIWHKNGWGSKVIENNGVGKGKGFKDNSIEITLKYSEIIGNIYENPELLGDSE